MRTRRARGPWVVLFTTLLLCCGAWPGAPRAAAAGHEGACTDDAGVTVVVDHQGIGGGITVRCATDLPEGATGLDALRLAGFTPTGTIKDGASLVCRINDRPSADEVIRAGGLEYREDCIQTPPAWAFWGYWYASPGGEWKFSSMGAAGRTVEPGGYEGWSFSIDKATGSNPPPGHKPAARPTPTPTPPKPTPTTPTATKTSAPVPKPTTTKPAAPTTAPQTIGTTSKPQTTTPTTSPSSQTPTVTALPSTVPTTAATTSTTTLEATHTPSTRTDEPASSPTSPNSPTANTTAGPVEATPPDESGWLGPLLSIAAVSLLAGAGGFVWWRRRAAL